MVSDVQHAEYICRFTFGQNHMVNQFVPAVIFNKNPKTNLNNEFNARVPEKGDFRGPGAAVTDQSWRDEQVGHSEDGQTAHTGSDPAAILELADRKSLTLRQVELNVPLRQSLQEHRQRGKQVRHAWSTHNPTPTVLSWSLLAAKCFRYKLENSHIKCEIKELQ